MDLRLYDLKEDDFDEIIRLGTAVMGPNYVTSSSLEEIYRSSCSQGRCCSKVMYDSPRGKGKLIGFRLTYAPGNWEIDEWCSPDEWGIEPDKVCYLKSNTIDQDYRRKGIGSLLLDLSIQTACQMGAEAGVAHIWMGSPGNSAFRYFVKNGAQLVWVWPNRWAPNLCPNTCEGPCHCSGAEMIIHFGEQDNE